MNQKRKVVSNEEFEQALNNTDYKKVIKKVLGHYANSLTSEELHDCGLHGLWRFLGYHQTNKGKKDTTNLWWFVSNECKRAMRKRLSAKPAVSIEFDIENPQDNPEVQHIRECISLLPKHYQNVLKQYYFEKRTMEEIGKLNDYTKETARQKINKALNQLREIYLQQP